MSEEKIPLAFTDYTSGGSFRHRSIHRRDTHRTRYCCYLWIIIALMICLLIGAAVGLVIAFGKSDSSDKPLQEAFKVNNALETLKQLQYIANDFDPPSRSVQSGYNKSAEYIKEQLESAGYNVTLQHFEVPVYTNLAEGQAVFTANYSDLAFTWTFLEGSEYAVMSYSGSGTVDGSLQLVNGTACAEGDFTDFIAGSVALLDYSNTECSLYDKASNAVDAGASAIVMMRDENTASSGPPTSRIFGGGPEDTVSVPVLGSTYQLGQKLLDLIVLSQYTLEVHIETSTSVTIATTYNVLASTTHGKEDSIIVFGSHLDSVPAGPGINDNGSGSAGNLEIALALARNNLRPKNKVMFAFWGAEELGLLGSIYYVNNLSDEEKENIALNLNFDMIASPNYVRGVYNGSMADEEIRTQCETIQRLFEQRFIQKDARYSIFPFTGRSDYGSFIDPEISIPAGALATGSNSIKTEEERVIYGGFANVALDTCYHQACDTVDNIDEQVYEEMMDAAAYTLQVLMMQDDLRGYLNNNSTTS
ncbi:aminopeptidase-like [Dysidea avara]|uniref:aminopeptidase-like n=1 Tax=Dysidea avara TaxID=196820 RepID=UPI0033189DC8